MRDKGKVRRRRLKAERSGRKVSWNACKITSQVRQEKKRNILAGNSSSHHITTKFPELIPCFKKKSIKLCGIAGDADALKKKRPGHSRAS